MMYIQQRYISNISKKWNLRFRALYLVVLDFLELNDIEIAISLTFSFIHQCFNIYYFGFKLK